MTLKSPVEELTTLFKELDEYMRGLRQSRVALIVANKLDAADEGQPKLLNLIEWLAKESIEVDVYPCSARLGRGVDEIKTVLFELLRSSGRSSKKLTGLKMLPFRPRKAAAVEGSSAGREEAHEDSMLPTE
uniref:OBG-type G domain-containing protein n=2 Tax=Rhodosorus marinus TaxID=101924 RepID=A0A7S0BLL8_9RHOD|mmetsp:Transcript_22771/g.32771  ORF Transcript_22771/g.32771 Transcript_22771/m.32771 type:complete len:131 (+) Transcript_22771:404-796(+)